MLTSNPLWTRKPTPPPEELVCGTWWKSKFGSASFMIARARASRSEFVSQVSVIAKRLILSSFTKSHQADAFPLTFIDLAFQTAKFTDSSPF